MILDFHFSFIFLTQSLYLDTVIYSAHSALPVFSVGTQPTTYCLAPPRQPAPQQVPRGFFGAACYNLDLLMLPREAWPEGLLSCWVLLSSPSLAGFYPVSWVLLLDCQPWEIWRCCPACAAVLFRAFWSWSGQLLVFLPGQVGSWAVSLEVAEQGVGGWGLGSGRTWSAPSTKTPESGEAPPPVGAQYQSRSLVGILFYCIYFFLSVLLCFLNFISGCKVS